MEFIRDREGVVAGEVAGLNVCINDLWCRDGVRGLRFFMDCDGDFEGLRDRLPVCLDDTFLNPVNLDDTSLNLDARDDTSLNLDARDPEATPDPDLDLRIPEDLVPAFALALLGFKYSNF